ncbi:MAG TPA: hypothetical protein PLP17_13505, partial [Oligoflexia bacterium]|nr:hypothetical protein [Oligoflexia bacterium]
FTQAMLQICAIQRFSGGISAAADLFAFISILEQDARNLAQSVGVLTVETCTSEPQFLNGIFI